MEGNHPVQGFARVSEQISDRTGARVRKTPPGTFVGS